VFIPFITRRLAASRSKEDNVGKRSDSRKHISVEVWLRAAKAVDRYFSILYSVRDMMTCVYNPAATLTTITPLPRAHRCHLWKYSAKYMERRRENTARNFSDFDLVS
jgi:hypothetical protein